MHSHGHVVRGVPLIARTRTGYPVSSELVSAKVWLDTFSCPVRWQEDGLPSAWNYSSFWAFKKCLERLDVRVFDYLFAGDCNAPLLVQLEHLFTVEHLCAWGPALGGADGQPVTACQDAGCERCIAGRGGFRFNWIGPWTCVQAVGNASSPEDVTRRWVACSEGGGCKACKFMCALQALVSEIDHGRPEAAEAMPDGFISEGQWNHLVGPYVPDVDSEDDFRENFRGGTSSN